MRRTEVKRDMQQAMCMFWLSGLTGMFVGSFFLNYEKNYLTRDNIKENVPAGNLHTRTWKTSIEKTTRQDYDKHMTTSKKIAFFLYKYERERYT